MNSTRWLLSLIVGIAVVVGVMALVMNHLESANADPTAVAVASDTATPESVATATAAATPTTTLTPTLQATSTPKPTTSPTRTPTLSPTPFPYDTHPDLARFLYVDQMTQRLNIFIFGQLYRSLPCSTGLPTDTTYTEAWTGEVGQYYGTFFSFDVYADDAWYLYPSLGLILVHSLPYTYDEDGVKVYQDRELLGVQPASHGCIRISPEDAEWLTSWNPEGVLMTISDPYLEYWQETLDNEG